jgi:hypothetical protein
MKRPKNYWSGHRSTGGKVQPAGAAASREGDLNSTETPFLPMAWPVSSCLEGSSAEGQPQRCVRQGKERHKTPRFNPEDG